MLWQYMKLIRSLIVNVIVSWALLYFLGWMNWKWTTIGIKITFENPEISSSVISLIIAFLVLWFIFWVFNSPIKWILKTLSCPVNFLTLWLMSLVINVLIFYMFQYFVNAYFDWVVDIKLWEIWQTLILSFIMALCTSILTKIFK